MTLASLVKKKTEESSILKSEILRLKEELKTLTNSFDAQLAQSNENHVKDMESSLSSLKLQFLEKEKTVTEQLASKHLLREKELTSQHEKTIKNISKELAAASASNGELRREYEMTKKLLQDFENRNAQLEAELEKLKSENKLLFQTSLQSSETISSNTGKFPLNKESSPVRGKTASSVQMVDQPNTEHDKPVSSSRKRPPQLIFSSSEEEDRVPNDAKLTLSKSHEVKKGSRRPPRSRLMYSPKRNMQKSKKNIKPDPLTHNIPTTLEDSLLDKDETLSPRATSPKKPEKSSKKQDKTSAGNTSETTEQEVENFKSFVQTNTETLLKDASVTENNQPPGAVSKQLSSTVLKKSTFRPFGIKAPQPILSEENSSFLSNLSLSSISSDDSFSFAKQKHPVSVSIPPKVCYILPIF